VPATQRVTKEHRYDRGKQNLITARTGVGGVFRLVPRGDSVSTGLVLCQKYVCDPLTIPEDKENKIDLDQYDVTLHTQKEKGGSGVRPN